MWFRKSEPKKVLVKHYGGLSPYTPALKAEQDANKLAEKGYRLVSFEDKSGPLRGGLGFATYEYVGKDEAKKKK